ncbi:MAG: YicC family protein [Gemmatimonadetes bacterium]|nr:YicC family protein [Gemmatimonadota bacterium]
MAGGRLRLEVRSVNHRHLSVQLKLPGELQPLEADLRERLRAHMERGHVTVGARWAEAPHQAAGVQVDVERASAIVAALREVGKTLGLPGDMDLATVARLPDVVRVVHADATVEPAAVLAILDDAAAACVKMREREGRALAADLLERLRRLAGMGAGIAERAPARVVAERDRLRAAVTDLAAGIAVDPARLAQEVAFLADRMDITEELVRFGTHVAAMEAALSDSKAAVGKQLGFLLQELGREANTIGSKANDAAITETVIAIKGELEKIREQIENLE